MTFSLLDTAAAARALSQLAEREDDLVDAFFERLEVVELPPDGGPPGVRRVREEGLAVRLVRDGSTWLAGRDGITPRAFAEALRQVARVLPSTPYPEPSLELEPWPDDGAAVAEGLAELPLAVTREIRARHVAFPLGLTVRRHRRTVQVVGPRLVPEPEEETWYSLEARAPWGRWGTLLPSLDGAAARVAEVLVERFRSRHAAPPEAGSGPVILGPAATAVLLHEAVAHALEADVLALSGAPEGAVGLELGPPGLHVLDDPTTAPPGVRRASDDEGQATGRRWLLRDGVVEQPLADRLWARDSPVLMPGAGRRGGRHELPSPRSHHLELLPGERTAGPTPASAPEEGDEAGVDPDLLAEADGGLFLTEASRGSLDPRSGRFVLEVPGGRRVRRGTVTDPVGPCRLVGTVAGLLEAVVAVGATPRVAGAGWCAKGGSRLPVWATAPELRLEGLRVEPLAPRPAGDGPRRTATGGPAEAEEEDHG